MCLSTIFYAGAIGALIVCALFISLHLLKFLDLSCEGSYALGCMSFCAMDAAGYNIVVCFITAIFSGLACGLFTAMLRCYLNIPKIMCGLMTLALSIAIVQEGNIKDNAQHIISSYTIVNMLITIASVVPLLFLFKYIIDSEYGLKLRAFGRPMGNIRGNLNKDITIVPGLVISNGIVAFAGALSSQLHTNISLCYSGCGVFIFAMTIMLLGERVFSYKKNDICNYFLYLVSAGCVYRMFLEIVSKSCYSSDNSIITIISVSILLVMYGVTITQPMINSKIIKMTLDE